MGKTTDPDALTDLTSLFDAAKSGKLLTTTNGAGQARNITVRSGFLPNPGEALGTDIMSV